MSDDSESAVDDAPEADSDPDESASDPRFSDDGVILALAGAACLLAAGTAYSLDQPSPVVVFAVLAGIPAVVAVGGDLLTDYTPGLRPHLLLGVAALVGAVAAVPGEHYVNVATLGVASLMGLGRVFEVEVRGKGR
ncbi:hypothetical protein [Natronomonas gomsonensis]|uniref:hypothetical protein n=1 Tax=Natronomonas gomsonensis TaxID=1046043 RepID=UPI0015BED3F6|nr:hypothetical protein [Natronomonas gomsonensis]